MLRLSILAVALVGTATLAPEVTDDAAVYAAAFKGLYPSLKPPPELVVKDVAIPMPTLTGSAASWLEQFDDVPAPLRLAASRPIPTSARAFDAGLFPAGTRLVSEKEIQAVFVHGIEQNWASFRRRYGAEGWAAFSAILFAGDGTEALVYYEERCGSLCGEGGYIWLHREAGDCRGRFGRRSSVGYPDVHRRWLTTACSRPRQAR